MDRSRPPPLQYLLEASKQSLQGFLLAQLNKSANSRKEMKDVMTEWIEARALALLAEWFIEHGEELVALAASPSVCRAETTTQNERALEDKKRRREFWRSAPDFRRVRRAG
jgi:hypothetical protein